MMCVGVGWESLWFSHLKCTPIKLSKKLSETLFFSGACFDLQTAVVNTVSLFFQLMQTTFGFARMDDVSHSAAPRKEMTSVNKFTLFDAYII